MSGDPPAINISRIPCLIAVGVVAVGGLYMWK